MLERAPETFFEALQCVWFVQVILHIETNGHSLSFGRFDQYMNPFLQKDLKEGRITMEEAEEMLGCFYLKIYSNNKLRSWSNTLTQMGSPTYQNICLGGQKADKTDAVNEMSWLCLEMLDEIRLPEPTMYIRVHRSSGTGKMGISCKRKEQDQSPKDTGNRFKWRKRPKIRKTGIYRYEAIRRIYLH